MTGGVFSLSPKPMQGEKVLKKLPKCCQFGEIA
jgi:hypothetical protein